jgi:hypothetical protein
MKAKNIVHKYTEEIVCPFCGSVQRDSWEFSDEGAYECDCGRSFSYQRIVTVEYTTMCLETEHCWEILDQYGERPIGTKPHTYVECKDCGETRWIESNELAELNDKAEQTTKD